MQPVWLIMAFVAVAIFAFLEYLGRKEDAAERLEEESFADLWGD